MSRRRLNKPHDVYTHDIVHSKYYLEIMYKNKTLTPKFYYAIISTKYNILY